MSNKVDLWIVSYQRKELTENTINYILARTRHPYRLFVVDNHSTDGTWPMLLQMEKDKKIDLAIRYSRNVGIHMAHNLGLSLVDTDYCVSFDNDIYVPDLEPDWLTQLVGLMDNPLNRIYGAIACQPHAFIGAKGLDNAQNGVYEVPMCGAVARIMRTDLIKKVGGWDRRYDATRNHEEMTVCSRIQSAGGKVGYASDITCYHDFGDDDNWGYKEIHPHEHGHRIPGGSKWATEPDKRGELWPPPSKLQIKDQLNVKTWRRDG